jgi:hypothetical protein
MVVDATGYGAVDLTAGDRADPGGWTGHGDSSAAPDYGTALLWHSGLGPNSEIISVILSSLPSLDAQNAHRAE